MIFELHFSRMQKYLCIYEVLLINWRNLSGYDFKKNYYVSSIYWEHTIYIYKYAPCSVSKERTLKKKLFWKWKGKTQSRRDHSQHTMCFLKSCIRVYKVILQLCIRWRVQFYYIREIFHIYSTTEYIKDYKNKLFMKYQLMS